MRSFRRSELICNRGSHLPIAGIELIEPVKDIGLPAHGVVAKHGVGELAPGARLKRR
jgi:hypothetical protein